MPLKRDILWRVGVVYVLILLIGLIIAGKIFYIQVFQGKELSSKAEELNLKTEVVESNRGDIYSANNRLLASSVPYYEIRLDTRSTGLKMDSKTYFRKLDTLARQLAGLFQDKSAAQYRRELYQARKEGERFYLIKERVNYKALKELRTFPLFRKGRYKGGFIVIQKDMRIQPHGNLASRTIGYTTDWEGGNIVGIEGAYDNSLKGTKGVRLMRRIQGGIWIPVGDDHKVEPKGGKDVVTTININIQDVAESALREQLIEHNADHGTAVLMEVNTGEIRAIANLGKTDQGTYREIYNYAVGESREPGSTFKLASIMALLEDGYVSLDDTVDTEDGEVYYYDKKLTDVKPGGYGKISVREAFIHSSNVGISKIITRNYKNKPHQFVDRLYNMNLDEKLGLEIKGEGDPLIRYPGDKYWSGISLPMMSIGYEIRLTPMQILTFYNAVANDGEMVKPMFVKQIREHGNLVKSFDSEVINPAISSNSTIRKTQGLLKDVVQVGTARNLRNANFEIAGKTGTAQIANEKYGYMKEAGISYQASFVGYFPADDPKYSCIVVVNSPSKDVYYGNVVAGPVFREIAEKVYATSFEMHEGLKITGNEIENSYKVPYTKHSHRGELTTVLKKLGVTINDKNVDSEWVVTRKKDSLVELKNRYIGEGVMPNVIGMGVKDAIYILENMGLNVEMEGRGSIRKQSVPPGEPVDKGDKVELTMTFTE
ncbi:MAG: penicillin-binding protein [Bacteroidales bacterium]